MGHAFLRLVQIYNKIHGQYFFTEITFIQTFWWFKFQNGFIKMLQFSKRKLWWQQFKANWTHSNPLFERIQTIF